MKANMTTVTGYSEAIKAMIKANRSYGAPAVAIVEVSGGWVLVSAVLAKAARIGHEVAW